LLVAMLITDCVMLAFVYASARTLSSLGVRKDSFGAVKGGTGGVGVGPGGPRSVSQRNNFTKR